MAQKLSNRFLHHDVIFEYLRYQIFKILKLPSNTRAFLKYKQIKLKTVIIYFANPLQIK